jgi:ribonuclease HII
MSQKNKPTYDLEMELRNKGYRRIVGCDEAGRGCLALGVVAAAVILPDGFPTDEIRDSKQLSAKKRSYLFSKIAAECEAQVQVIDNEVIDSVNIRNATKMAMQFAIGKVRDASFALIDGDFVPDNLQIPARSVIGGDKICLSISAASIIAKVYRDKLVEKFHKYYPVYGWDKNKTYGTKIHREAIAKHGPCEYHRKTFSGVREHVQL